LLNMISHRACAAGRSRWIGSLDCRSDFFRCGCHYGNDRARQGSLRPANVELPSVTRRQMSILHRPRRTQILNQTVQWAGMPRRAKTFRVGWWKPRPTEGQGYRFASTKTAGHRGPHQTRLANGHDRDGADHFSGPSAIVSKGGGPRPPTGHPATISSSSRRSRRELDRGFRGSWSFSIDLYDRREGILARFSRETHRLNQWGQGRSY